MRRSKDPSDARVDCSTTSPYTPVFDVSDSLAERWTGAKNLLANRQSGRPTQTHYPDPPLPPWRRDSDNSIRLYQGFEVRLKFQVLEGAASFLK